VGASLNLVELAKVGDEPAFEDLLRPLLLPAYKLACVLLSDSTAAEDAVQEAAVKCWRKLHQLRPGTELKPWFLGIVANECHNTRRSRWWSVLKGLPTDHSIASKANEAERRSDIQRALRRLSPRSRLILILYYYFDMSLDQIAAVIHRRPAAARSQLYRALARLRDETALGYLEP